MLSHDMLDLSYTISCSVHQVCSFIGGIFLLFNLALTWSLVAILTPTEAFIPLNMNCSRYQWSLCTEAPGNTVSTEAFINGFNNDLICLSTEAFNMVPINLHCYNVFEYDICRRTKLVRKGRAHSSRFVCCYPALPAQTENRSELQPLLLLEIDKKNMHLGCIYYQVAAALNIWGKMPTYWT